MNRERWRQIDKLLDEALKRQPEDRAAFLDEACAGDETLRREVQSLIYSDEQARSYLEQPVFEFTVETLQCDQTSLAAGHAIGPYKIMSLLGAGGMGEVYRALDTRLGREVAIKLLPAALSTNQELLQRFEQEARAASALNHPNIITVHEIGQAASTHYIVTEYIQGETLREQLRRRQLGLSAALDVARQTASALDVAHAAGIVHRDIKPENIVVRRDGLVKVLDFGLAKLTAPIVAEPDTPTEPHLRTKSGVVMGTVAYMSPEQARGQQVDHRTDIFSLGVVLYELLTGQRPFQGASTIDVLHAIIHQEPIPVIQLNPRLPAEVTDIVGKALAKELSERYRHVGDFELDLRRLNRAARAIQPATADGQPSPDGQPPWTIGRRRLVGALVGTLVIAASILAGWWIGRSGAEQEQPSSLENVVLTPLTTDSGYEGEPTFSPGGETIAYVSDRTGNFEIFLKQVSGGPDINLTNNVADDVQPAFSPDGNQIAFVSSRSGSSDLFYPGYDLPLTGGDIWVMQMLGGAARLVAERGNFPSWSPDGSAILYASGPQFGQNLYRVSAQGGGPREIALKFAPGVVFPRFLLYPSYSSDERWIVFDADSSGLGTRDIFVVRAEGGEVERIASGQSPVWSADSRAVIYSSAEEGKNYALWQVRFSTEQGRVLGPPEPLTVSRGRDTHATVSRVGNHIAFAGLEISFNAEALAFDVEAGHDKGSPQAITSGSGVTYFQSFSADGNSVVYEARQGIISHLWRVDRNRLPVQLTVDPDFADTHPRWSPHDRTIAFNRRPLEKPLGATGIWLMAEDGGNPRQLIERAGFFTWMPDGRGLIYLSYEDSQLYLFDLATTRAHRLTNEPKINGPMTTSPDGQWVIFQSTRSGNIDLFTMPIAGGETRTVVATPHQDQHPFVSPSGRWLYFESDHKNLWRVPGPAQNWKKVEPERVTSFPESGLLLEDFQASRDGRWLLYSRARIKGDIWIMGYASSPSYR